MDENEPTLFTKIVLRHDAEPSMLHGPVALEIEESYKIGKSVAVLKQGIVLGHLEMAATRVVWRFLRSGSPLSTEIYGGIGKWTNERWFSSMTFCFEIGVKIRFSGMNRENGKLLLAHIARKRMNTFPGVEVDKCPEELVTLIEPVKDENGLTSIFFTPPTFDQ